MNKYYCDKHPEQELVELWVEEYGCETCLEECGALADATATFDGEHLELFSANDQTSPLQSDPSCSPRN